MGFVRFFKLFLRIRVLFVSGNEQKEFKWFSREKVGCNCTYKTVKHEFV